MPIEQTALLKEIKDCTVAYRSRKENSDSNGTIMRKAKEALGEGNFNEAKLLLETYRDKKRLMDSNPDKKRLMGSKLIKTAIDAKPLAMPIYLSDQRKQVDEKGQGVSVTETDSFENWAIMGLSYFQTAIRIIEIEMEYLKISLVSADNEEVLRELQSAKEVIQQKAAAFLEYIIIKTEYKSQKAKDYMNGVVRGVVAEDLHAALKGLGKNSKIGSKSPNDSLKTMMKFKDFTNMDSEPVATVTLISESGIDIAYTDIPLYQLTEKQQGWFRAISKGKSEPKWFTQQDKKAQAFIKHYANKILEGRPIPTQLLKYLPIMRNAEKTVADWYYSNETTAQPKQFYEDHNSGNFGFEIKKLKLTKAEQDELIQESVEQAKLFTGAKKLYINSLLTGNWIRSFFMSLMGGQSELRLIEQVKSGVNSLKTKDVVYGNTPLNHWRTLEANNMAVIESIRKEVDETIDAMLKEKQTDEKKRLLIMLYETREEDKVLANENRYQGGSGYFDPENDNMKLVSKAKQMISLINQLRSPKEKIVLFTPCKSGKDRAGEARALGLTEASVQLIQLTDWYELERLKGHKLDHLYNRVFSRKLKNKYHPFIPDYSSVTKTNGKIYNGSLFKKIMRQTLHWAGAKAGRQSPGAEGIKDGEGITPNYIAATQREALLKETAKFNASLPEFVGERSWAKYIQSFFKLSNWNRKKWNGFQGALIFLGLKQSDVKKIAKDFNLNYKTYCESVRGSQGSIVKALSSPSLVQNLEVANAELHVTEKKELKGKKKARFVDFLGGKSNPYEKVGTEEDAQEKVLQAVRRVGI